MDSKSKPTCLIEIHEKHRAKLTSFFGYTLPLWYSSIKEEHHAVRKAAGIFDISHMGMLHVSGDGALRFLEHMSSNKLDKVAKGFFVYTMLLNREGGIRDDIMVGPMGADYLVIVNASNHAKIRSWLQEHKPETVHIRSQNDTHGLMAIQGPLAVRLLSQLLQKKLSTMKAFALQPITYKGAVLWVSRTGYTGEDGFEIMCPQSLAPEIFTELLTKGATPCGLGARDSLRIEAGLPLYGQELSETLSPRVTRYANWVIKPDRPFLGKTAVEKDADLMTTVGLKMEGKSIPRTGYPIVEGGHITSGTLSPSLGEPIGMALVPKTMATPGTTLHVTIRNVDEKATVVALPFIQRTPAAIVGL
jgi:aminomethyltransferase